MSSFVVLCYLLGLKHHTKSHMLLHKYCILLLIANSRKNHIVNPKPAILALLGTLPATALTPGVQVLVPPFATSPETELVQMYFSPALCQLSPHRITELTFVVHTFPAKCLNMSLTGTERYA